VIPTHFLVLAAVQVKLEQVSVKGTSHFMSQRQGNRESSVKIPSTFAVLPSAILLSQSTQVVKNQIVQKI